MTKFNKSKEWLIEEYVIKGRSRKEVAIECGLSEAGLKSLLTKLDIKKEKLDISKEKIQELIESGKTHKEIEDLLNIGQTTLYRYLKKYNLEIKVHQQYDQYDDSNDELICALYLDGFSSVEIGKEFNISARTVLNHLDHCGLKRRSLVEAQWNSNNKVFPKDLNNKEFLYDLYINKQLSKKDIATQYDCDPCVIKRLLLEFNIPIRNNSESKIGLSCGDKHWNWQGGVTSLARRLREHFGCTQTKRILERDNYCCQLCGSKVDLHVHHVKSFSSILKRILEEHKDLDPVVNVNELYNIAIKDKNFNDLNNLVTYCKYCHFTKIHGYNLQADFKSRELLEA